MRALALTVTEIATSAGQVHVRCGGSELNPTPGQFYLAWAATPKQSFLRLPILPYLTPIGGLEFCVASDHPYAALEPGQTLDVIGPCGRGFNLPAQATHLLLKCDSPARLLGLIYRALDARLNVTLLLPEAAPLPEAPLDVEIARGPLTIDLADWADVVALDVADPVTDARLLRSLCPMRPAEFVQALILPPMPCGTGACQACWVETGPHPHRRRLACVDGPVFNL